MACPEDVRTLALLVVLALPPQGWRSYTNVRFGYALDYPRTMEALPEADNSDGRRFTDRRRRLDMEVWGEHRNGRTLEAFYRDARRETAERARVTYGAVRGGAFVLSGFERRMIFYRRTIRLRNGEFASVLIRYDKALKRELDRDVTRISRSLRAVRS